MPGTNASPVSTLKLNVLSNKCVIIALVQLILRKLF
jgi:hypothetical protein